MKKTLKHVALSIPTLSIYRHAASPVDSSRPLHPYGILHSVTITFCDKVSPAFLYTRGIASSCIYSRVTLWSIYRFFVYTAVTLNIILWFRFMASYWNRFYQLRQPVTYTAIMMLIIFGENFYYEYLIGWWRNKPASRRRNVFPDTIDTLTRSTYSVGFRLAK